MAINAILEPPRCPSDDIRMSGVFAIATRWLKWRISAANKACRLMYLPVRMNVSAIP
nr:MAG TPA: hypothetical protein [Caudoviricetes sp.]